MTIYRSPSGPPGPKRRESLKNSLAAPTVAQFAKPFGATPPIARYASEASFSATPLVRSVFGLR